MKQDKIEKIARLCHELNRRICEIIGDHSQQAWEDAPEIIKNSARVGVESHLENPDLTPEESHDLWMDFKLKEGWVRSATKSVEAKTHPLLCPYDELPLFDRLKDHVFSCAVKYAREI